MANSEPTHLYTDPWRRALVALLPFALGYVLSYWVRTLDGTQSAALIRAFALGPGDLGLLTAMFFLAFAAFQIPAGMLIDRFGPRPVQSVLLAVAALGGVVFASAHGIWGLIAGRALIGLGCSAALLAGMKAATDLAVNRRALAFGALVACGGLGAMAASIPFAWANPAQGSAWAFALAAAAVALLIALAGPAPACAPTRPAREITRGMAQILTDRRFWRVAPLAASAVGADFAIQGLWAGRWLVAVRHATPRQAEATMLVMGAALVLGGLGFGLLVARRRGPGAGGVMARRLAHACIAFLVVQAVLAATPDVPAVLPLAAVGGFGALTVLSFTVIGELFPPAMAGRACAALNVLQLGAAFAAQAGFGGILAVSRAAGAPAGVAYGFGFAALALVQVAALAWFAASVPGRREAGLQAEVLAITVPVSIR